MDHSLHNHDYQIEFRSESDNYIFHARIIRVNKLDMMGKKN